MNWTGDIRCVRALVFRRSALALVSLAIVAILSIGPCAAAELPLTGTWQGKLTINPSTQLTVQFIVKRDKQDRYVAVLNAPNEPNLKNIPVTSVKIADHKVEFVVNDVNGSYEGQLQGRQIDGQWQQNGTSFPLNLTPYVKEKITPELAAHLNGTWHGILDVPNTDMKIPLVFHFKADAKSANGVSATIDSPNQSAFGIMADDVSLEDGKLNLEVSRMKMGFNGKVEGDRLVGYWVQGKSMPLAMTKGAYRAAGLQVAQAERKRLIGDWYGVFSNGVGIAFRFKQEADGRFEAYLDSPHEGRKNIRFDVAKVDGDNVSFAATAIGMTFKGKLTQQGISGTFAAGGNAPRQLTLHRGDYVPESFQIPRNLAAKLLGRWEGKAANTNMILRFELNRSGNVVASQDIPNRQIFDVPITDVKFDGQALKLTVKGISAEFKGNLAKNEISGDWTMPSLQFPITFSRSAATPN